MTRVVERAGFSLAQGLLRRDTALGHKYRVIKDFDIVPIDGDKTFSASVFFTVGPSDPPLMRRVRGA